MKKIFLFVLMVFSFAFVSAQKKKNAGEKISKVVTSDIRWWGYKVVKSEATTHTGFVKLKSGKFVFKDQKFDEADFIIDMRSLANTDLEGEDQLKLTNDLKSTNFFYVKKFPIAKFQLTKILPSKDSDYNSIVYGNVTIKGVRKTISFPANVNFNGYSVSLESAKFSLNRQDFKAFYKSSLKDYLIKDEIDVQIKVATK